MAGKQVDDAVYRCLDQGGRDVTPVRGEQSNANNVFVALRGEMANWPVPDSLSAKKLFEGYKSFLQAQEHINQKNIGQIIATLENLALTVPQKRQQVDQIFSQLDTVDSVSFNEVVQLQRDFAREHKLTLNPRR